MKKANTALDLLKKLWPVLIITGLVLFYLRGPLFFGKSFCIVNTVEFHPWKDSAVGGQQVSNPSANDQLLSYLPRKVMYSRALLGRGSSSWSHLLMGGYPIGADSQMGWFDPFNLLFLFLPVSVGFILLGILQWLLGGVFTYLFLRQVSVGRFGAMAGGVAFFTQPFFITRLPWPPALQSAIWLPYLLWMFERMMGSSRPGRYVPAIALGITLSAVSGYMPVFMLVMVSWILYSVLRILFGPTDNYTSSPRRNFGVVTVALILGMMLASVQIIPTIEAGRFSIRREIPIEAQKKFALPGQFLVTLANPYSLGRPTNETWSGFAEKIKSPPHDWGSPTSFLEDNHYVGWAVLLAAICALWFRRKDARTLIAGVTAGLAILILYGTFVLDLAYYLVPGFKSARPDRVVFVWGTFVSVLAGLGFEEIIRYKSQRRKFFWGLSLASTTIALGMAASGVLVKLFPHRLLSGLSEVSAEWKYLGLFAVENSSTWSADAFTMAGVAFLCAFILILSTRWRRTAGILLFGVLLFEAGLISGRYLTFQQNWLPSEREPSIKFLEKQPGRIVRFGETMTIFPSNLPTVWNIPDAQGREAVFLKHWGRYFDTIEEGSFRRAKKLTAFKKIDSLESKLLDAAGVKYVVSAKPIPGIDRTTWKPVHSDGMCIYKNEEVYPPAWITPHARFVKTGTEAVEAIAAPDFAPYQLAVIEGEPMEHEGEKGAVRVEKSRGNIKINLEDNSGGWLVVSEVWYPGWRVQVDGQPRPAHKADVAFMAVKVNKGEKKAVFRYRNNASCVGGILALLGLAGSFAVWLTMRKRAVR